MHFVFSPACLSRTHTHTLSLSLSTIHPFLARTPSIALTLLPTSLFCLQVWRSERQEEGMQPAEAQSPGEGGGGEGRSEQAEGRGGEGDGEGREGEGGGGKGGGESGGSDGGGKGGGGASGEWREAAARPRRAQGLRDLAGGQKIGRDSVRLRSDGKGFVSQGACIVQWCISFDVFRINYYTRVHACTGLTAAGYQRRSMVEAARTTAAPPRRRPRAAKRHLQAQGSSPSSADPSESPLSSRPTLR